MSLEVRLTQDDAGIFQCCKFGDRTFRSKLACRGKKIRDVPPSVIRSQLRVSLQSTDCGMCRKKRRCTTVSTRPAAVAHRSDHKDKIPKSANRGRHPWNEVRAEQKISQQRVRTQDAGFPRRSLEYKQSAWALFHARHSRFYRLSLRYLSVPILSVCLTHGFC